MANEDDSDLVSEIRIEGSEDATKKIEVYADKGAEAFDKLGEAAKKAGDEVEAGSKKSEKAVTESAEKTEKAAKRTRTSLDGLGQANKDLQKENEKTSASLNKLGLALGTKLGQSIGKNIKDFAQFATRVAALGTAGAAAGVGILRLAQNVAKASSTSKSAIDEQTQAQMAANTAAGQATIGAINFEASQRALFRQLQSGSIDYETYNNNLLELRRNYQEQIRISARVEAAQEAVRLENERLQKQAADRKAYQALTDTYGGALTSSLVALGRTVQTVSDEFRDTLGPAVSSVLDLANDVISRNLPAIRSFFSSAAQTIQQFVSQNGPAISSMFESIGQAAGMIFSAVVENAPKFVSVFNDVIVPAVKDAYARIKAILDLVNSVFGTNLTPGLLAIGVVLLRLTGGFQLLFGLLRTGSIAVEAFSLALGAASGNGVTFLQFIRLAAVALGPWGIAIAALVAGLTALYFAVDWTALGQQIRTFADGVTQWFSELPDKISAFFTETWAVATATTKSWVDSTIALFQSILDWFVSLPSQISELMDGVGAAIQSAFDAAFAYVRNLVTSWVTWFTQQLQPAIDIINTIKSFMSGNGGGETSSPPGFARGGHAVGRVRGPGTSTSDSIAAWLSNNEFVVRAKAVAKYGVGFMNALNEGRIDLAAPLRLAAGGLASVGTPTFSYVGAAGDSGGGDSGSGLRPFALHLDGQVFDGLFAPENVADKMINYSVHKKIRSTGRKPNWVR